MLRPRPCSVSSAGIAPDRGVRAQVGDDDGERLAARQAGQLEADRPSVGVRYRVGDEFGGDRLGVLGVAAQIVIAECRSDVEARHLDRVRGTRQRERDE